MKKYTWISQSTPFVCQRCNCEGKFGDGVIGNGMRTDCISCGAEHIIVCHPKGNEDFTHGVYMTIELIRKYNWRKL